MSAVTKAMMPLVVEAVERIEGSSFATVEITTDINGAVSVTVSGANKVHEVHSALHALFLKYCRMSNGHYSASIMVLRP